MKKHWTHMNSSYQGPINVTLCQHRKTSVMPTMSSIARKWKEASTATTEKKRREKNTKMKRKTYFPIRINIEPKHNKRTVLWMVITSFRCVICCGFSFRFMSTYNGWKLWIQSTISSPYWPSRKRERGTGAMRMLECQMKIKIQQQYPKTSQSKSFKTDKEAEEAQEKKKKIESTTVRQQQN